MKTQPHKGTITKKTQPHKFYGSYHFFWPPFMMPHHTITLQNKKYIIGHYHISWRAYHFETYSYRSYSHHQRYLGLESRQSALFVIQQGRAFRVLPLDDAGDSCNSHIRSSFKVSNWVLKLNLYMLVDHLSIKGFKV